MNSTFPTPQQALHALGHKDAGPALRGATLVPGPNGSILVSVYGDSEPAYAPSPRCGWSAGEVTNANGTMVTLGREGTQEVEETVADLVSTLSATLAHAPVSPGTLSISIAAKRVDASGRPFAHATPWTLVDLHPLSGVPSFDGAGLGELYLAGDTATAGGVVGPVGTVNYATGDLTLRPRDTYRGDDAEATYYYTDLPVPGRPVPPAARLSHLILELVSGASVTSVDVLLQEGASAGVQVAYAGTHAISPAAPYVRIPLGDQVSIGQGTPAQRKQRFLKLTPNNATNEFKARLYWTVEG